MKVSDTISVNPGKTALGHVETPSTLFRNPVLGVESSRHFDILNICFPTSKGGTTEFRKYDVPLRTIFATILIVTGITMLTIPYGIHGTAFAVCTLCFGSFLALGLLTRPIMLGAAIFYCIVGALSLRAGLADITIFSLMFGCLIFAVLGSGKYSCDALIRNGLMRLKKRSKIKREQEMLGYKAFHKVRF